MLKPVHRFQPLDDPRWGEFLRLHSRASIFHTAGWLEALRRTHGYEPIAMTTCPPGEDLRNAVVFCRVQSWLTGQRLVSLPFSDHCDVLVDGAPDLVAIASAFGKELRAESLRYVETRSLRAFDTAAIGPRSSHSYCLHQIDLKPDLDTIFGRFHKDSTQRKIRRAEREGLTLEEGRSELLFDNFYRLLLLTRRRHKIPPQPKRWFQNLIESFGEALKFRVALKDKQPIAAILTLSFKDTLFYKYGCSDARFHNLGGMHLLFWRSIQEGKQDGLCLFDLGRSEWEDAGLIAFKDRWGAKRSVIPYVRFLSSSRSNGAFAGSPSDWMLRSAKGLFSHLPDRMLCSAGDLIYRHMG